MSVGIHNISSGSEEMFSDDTQSTSHVGLGSSSIFHSRPMDWKAPKQDSGHNSLEYLDYITDLEVTNGPSDLQLAAELGKMLLERKKELESTIEELRTEMESKTQEIEYLSKQTTALREVNNSRLRIYEELEISIQHMEITNQKLTDASVADKKMINNLNTTVSHLESRILELQNELEDLRSQKISQKSQEKNTNNKRSVCGEKDDSMSCCNTSKCCEEKAFQFEELQTELETLQTKLKASLEDKRHETAKREDLETKLESAIQENDVIREQLLLLKDRQTKSFEDELLSMEETLSDKICKKCMTVVEELRRENNLTEDFLYETDVTYDDIEGKCSLVRLKNGGYAWGSQDSLVSMGCLVNSEESNGTSLHSGNNGTPNSLLSELDTQYRILIEKYEALVNASESKNETLDKPTKTSPSPSKTLVDSALNEVTIVHNDDPLTSNMTAPFSNKCDTCSCNRLKETTTVQKNTETQTTTSVISVSEKLSCSRSTQTNFEQMYPTKDNQNDRTPKPSPQHAKTTIPNHCDKRLDNTPLFKVLCHDIVKCLKKDDDGENVRAAATKCLNSQGPGTTISSTHNADITTDKKKSIEVQNHRTVDTTMKEDRTPLKPTESSNSDQVVERSSKGRRRRRQRHQSNVKHDSNNSTEKNDTDKLSNNGLSKTSTDKPLVTAPTQPVNTDNGNQNFTKKRQFRQTLHNKHLTRVLEQSSLPPPPPRQCHLPTKNLNSPTFSPQILPSVQVAKLIKFERTFCRSLKIQKTLKFLYFLCINIYLILLLLT